MRINTGTKVAVSGRDYRPGGRGSESFFNQNGQLNAGSKQEAAMRILELASAIERGEVLNRQAEEATIRTEDEKIEAMKELASAYHDQDRTNWKETGSIIAAELKESVDREGYVRRLTARGEVQQGSVVRHRVKRKTTSALVASGPSSINTEMVRGHYLMPPEFEIKARIGISNMELNQGSPDLLDEKYFEAQEQIGKVEDTLFLDMVRRLGGLPNAVTYVVGSYTASGFSTIQFQVRNWGYDCQMILMASDIMSDLLTNSTFLATFDPVTQYENIMSGTIARLFGTDIVTDQFRDPRLKVLNAGEMFAFAPPEYLGAHTDRGPIESTPIDEMVVNGYTGKGWAFSEIMSLSLHNGRAVGQGSR